MARVSLFFGGYSCKDRSFLLKKQLKFYFQRFFLEREEGEGNSEVQAGDAAAGTGEEDGVPFFRHAADMEAGSGDQMPAQAVIIGDIYTGGPAA